MPSNADAVSHALDAGVSEILTRVRELAAPNPVILIDGQSGSGKTTLTARLAKRWPYPNSPQVVALDSVYPGWHGLDAGVQHVYERILFPHARSEVSVWTSWDWAAGTPGENFGVNPALALIVEGSGIVTPQTAPLADICVWVDSPAHSRYERAMRRDGETYAPYWEMWAAQEQRHVRRDEPQKLASITVRVPEAPRTYSAACSNPVR